MTDISSLIGSLGSAISDFFGNLGKICCGTIGLIAGVLVTVSFLYFRRKKERHK